MPPHYAFLMNLAPTHLRAILQFSQHQTCSSWLERSPMPIDTSNWTDRTVLPGSPEPVLPPISMYAEHGAFLQRSGWIGLQSNIGLMSNRSSRSAPSRGFSLSKRYLQR